MKNKHNKRKKFTKQDFIGVLKFNPTQSQRDLDELKKDFSRQFEGSNSWLIAIPNDSEFNLINPVSPKRMRLLRKQSNVSVVVINRR